MKIRPGVTPPAAGSAAAALFAAQNEFEAFQVVVTGAATGVSMALEALDDGKGHVISGRDLTLYREALINVTQPTGADGAAGIWPDALVPAIDPVVGEKRNAFPFDVPAGESRAVLVDIHVPDGAPAGTYTGVLNVLGDVTAQIPVSLEVWDFAIPSTSTLRTSYDMSWNGPCMGHGDGSCANATAEQQLRARYLQAALDNRITINRPTYTSPVDGSGSGSWADYDLYAGPFLSGTANTRLRGAKVTSTQIQGNARTTSAGVKAWSDHFKAKGWSNVLFNYICDEPPATCAWTDINPRIAASRAGDPAIPTLVTTTTDELAQNGITGVDLVVPVVDHMENRPGTAYAGSQRSKYGPTIWWYQSCNSFGCGPGSNVSGWPTYAIDADATRNRAMEWMSFSYDSSGELYYETTMAFFNGDPWTNQFNFGGTGDGTLFLPGNHREDRRADGDSGGVVADEDDPRRHGRLRAARLRRPARAGRSGPADLAGGVPGDVSVHRDARGPGLGAQAARAAHPSRAGQGRGRPAAAAARRRAGDRRGTRRYRCGTRRYRRGNGGRRRDGCA